MYTLIFLVAYVGCKRCMLTYCLLEDSFDQPQQVAGARTDECIHRGHQKLIIMFLYNVGVYTPYGRVIRQYYAATRTEACNEAWAAGYTVVDCDYHEHD